MTPKDPKIIHPDPDTEPNKGKNGNPPPTWDPGKVTQREAHIFSVADDGNGKFRWECFCGETGRWGKTTDADRLYDGWLAHTEESNI